MKKLTRDKLWNRLKLAQFILGGLLVASLSSVMISFNEVVLITFWVILNSEIVVSLWAERVAPVRVEDFSEDRKITPEFLDYLEYEETKKRREKPLWIAKVFFASFILADSMLLYGLFSFGSFLEQSVQLMECFFVIFVFEVFICGFVATRTINESGKIRWKKKLGE